MAAAVGLVLGAIALVSLTDIPRAMALRRSASQGFCTAVLEMDRQFLNVNFEVPGQPFFSDGNNDGIADQLQFGHAGLPSLADDLEALANKAPSDLQDGLRALATDAKQLAFEPVPVSAAQSLQQVQPIERHASVVHRSLEAQGCLAKFKAANSKAESGDDGLNEQDRVVVAVGLFVLVNIPLIRRLWRHRRRPALNAEGSRFKGNLRRWNVQTISGKVLNVQRDSVVSAVGGTYAATSRSVRLRTTTTTTETIRLALAGGTQTDVSLVNFMASPSIGDAVTVCVGQKRSREVAFALLNHTTNRQVVQRQNLFSLREGGETRQSIFAVGFVFGAFASVLIAVLGGAPWLIAVWLVLLGLFAVLSKREASIDLRPVWRRANEEVEPLRF